MPDVNSNSPETAADSPASALIIGANGGIGAALCQLLRKSGRYQQVVAVSRQPGPGGPWFQVDSQDEQQVAQFVQQCISDRQTFTDIISCIGTLHGTQFGPEKKLEDVNAEQLMHYFQVNSIAPAHWLKHAVRLFAPKQAGRMLLCSARVGSISDNGLGGWYGYRASKAALNMLVKTAAIEYRRRRPQVTLACYHPGTVDTDLSKPFQANVPADKLFTPGFAAARLDQVMQGLTLEHSPHYVDWQGKPINW